MSAASSPPMQYTHRPLRRGLKVLALVLSLVAEASALVHMGVVHHDVCPEHGELVEGPASRVRATHATSPWDVIGVGGIAATGADDHCVAGAPTRRSVETRIPGFSLGVPARALTASRPVGLSPRVTRDILAVAPKQGPPAA